LSALAIRFLATFQQYLNANNHGENSE
jgi:hypothetical protein